MTNNGDDSEHLLVERSGSIMTVEFNRPEVRNALTTRMLTRFDELLDEAEDDPGVKVVVLLGRGKDFSSGHDLTEVAPEYGSRALQLRKPVRTRSLPRGWFFSKGLIAGVQGYIGPQATLLMSPFDFIIAAAGARFSFEQVGIGGSAKRVAEIMYFQLPMRVMKKLRLMGGWFDADQALKYDLVQRVVPEEDLRKEVMRWAEQLAQVPVEQVRTAKENVHRAYELMGLAQMATSGNLIAGHGSTVDREFWDTVETEGVRAALKLRERGTDPTIRRV